MGGGAQTTTSTTAPPLVGIAPTGTISSMAPHRSTLFAVMLVIVGLLGAPAAHAATHFGGACRLGDEGGFRDGEELIKTPRPHEVMDVRDLPTNWFWGNVTGINYLTCVRRTPSAESPRPAPRRPR